MRIPSQLNDDTLYGRRNRKSSSPQSMRRVFRLAVALALVVVVMQQAGQPGTYEVFFGSPDQDVTGDENTIDSSASSELAKAPHATEPKSVPESIKLSARLITDALTVNEQRQWTVVLDRWQKGEPFRVMEPVIDSTIDLVQQLEDLPDDQRDPWRDSLRTFGQRFASPDRIPPDSGLAINDSDDDTAKNPDVNTAGEQDTRQRFAAWLAALDQAAVDRVIDGAIWRSEDFDAFYRQLDQAPTLDSRGAAAVAIVPLMQQPKTYLGTKVRVKGNVARAINKEATSNPFGVTKYWELWVRPSTGGDRPFVLIVPEVPAKVQAVDADATAKKGPEVEVVGRFFKRLGYASSFGADAAPVIVGRVSGLRSLAASSGPLKVRYAKTSPAVLSRFWKTLGLASLAGLSLAGVVIWRSNVSARRSRRLRNEHRTSPQTFLSDLADRT